MPRRRMIRRRNQNDYGVPPPPGGHTLPMCHFSAASGTLPQERVPGVRSHPSPVFEFSSTASFNEHSSEIWKRGGPGRAGTERVARMARASRAAPNVRARRGIAGPSIGPECRFDDQSWDELSISVTDGSSTLWSSLSKMWLVTGWISFPFFLIVESDI